MLKKYLRYCLPTTIVLLAVFGISIAAQIQSYQAGGVSVAGVDTNGGYTITGSGAFNASYAGTSTITGGSMAAETVVYAGSGVVTSGTLSAGTLSVFEPMQGSEYKQLVISCTGGVTATSNTLGITFPTPFAISEGTISNTGPTAPLMQLVITAGTGGVLTVASTGTSGVLVIGGQ